jgi:hypothetical protein
VQLLRVETEAITRNTPVFIEHGRMDTSAQDAKHQQNEPDVAQRG